MSAEQTLTPVEQKNVAFYADRLIAVRSQEGTRFVPVRPICVLGGVNFDGQRRRINRDPVFSEETMFVVVPTTGIDPGGRRIDAADYMVALKIK